MRGPDEIRPGSRISKEKVIMVSSWWYVSNNDNDSLTYQWFLFAEYNPRPKQLFLEDQLYTFYFEHWDSETEKMQFFSR